MATEAALEQHSESTTTSTTSRLEATICSLETISEHQEDKLPDRNTEEQIFLKKGDRDDPFVGARIIDTVPSAISALTDTEVSPPISAASSVGDSEDESVSDRSASQFSFDMAEKFKRELSREIQRRHSLAAKIELSAEDSSTEESHVQVSQRTKDRQQEGPNRVVQNDLLEQKSASEPEPIEEDWATKRKMISSAVEIVLLNRKLLNGIQNEARLQKQLDKVTSSATIHESTSKGMTDKMVLLEGLLRSQSDIANKLSLEKEQQEWHERRSAYRKRRQEDQGQLEHLQERLASLTKCLANERVQSQRVVQEKDNKITSMEEEIRKQTETMGQLEEDNINLAQQLHATSEELSMQKAQNENIKSELAKTQRKLSDELMVTEELEKLHETFRKKGDLQDQRIRKLAKQLQQYSQKIKQKESELKDIKFTLGGDSNLSRQLKDIQEAYNEDSRLPFKPLAQNDSDMKREGKISTYS